MSISDFDQENVIPVTEANLKDEQKEAIAQAVEEFKLQCLRSFSINKSGEVIQKDALPAPRQVTFEANPGKLQDMVDSAINRALINKLVYCLIRFSMPWQELSRKDKSHQIMWALFIISQQHRRLRLHRLLWPLRVHNLPSLQVHWE